MTKQCKKRVKLETLSKRTDSHIIGVLEAKRPREMKQRRPPEEKNTKHLLDLKERTFHVERYTGF